MERIERKRLNNKGFTLIELLAVVVILAVVMGIATTSVLSAMNKSRGGSLTDSAMVIANAFNQKYTESLVGGVPSDVYGDVLGSGNGYNFQSSSTYYLDKKLAATFNIAESGYAFANSANSININYVNKVDTNAKLSSGAVKNSFVTFDVSTGKFIVCMFANNAGSYYVDNYKLTADKAIGGTSIKGTKDTMYACSNGEKSW